MNISEKFVSEFNKLKSNCAASGQDEPKITTQVIKDEFVRVSVTVLLPNEDKSRGFSSEILVSQINDLPQAYISLFELVNIAWDRFSVKD